MGGVGLGGDVHPYKIVYWADVCPWLTSIDQLFIVSSTRFNCGFQYDIIKTF